MDPISHTLVGAALGEAGLKHRTALGMTTLILAANLPDLDVLAYAFGNVAALEFRRGWTHGVLAMAALPVALTLLLLAWDRRVRGRGGRHPARSTAAPRNEAQRSADARPTGREAGRAVVPRHILLLAIVGVLTHPALDFLNVYGIRFLMPFSERWFYGDALFIIDPWLWLLLGGGVALARRRGQAPARIALVLAACYTAAMLASGQAARGIVARQATAMELPTPERVMLAPLPLTPLKRYVVLDVGDRYEIGSFGWLPEPRFSLSGRGVEKGSTTPAAVRAARTREGRGFLRWARFPHFVVRPGGPGPEVRIRDARYPGPAGDWAGLTVRVPTGHRR
ncbi:MAG: metal-dependent hydrolase [Gemmatimonadota bacterium]